MKRGVQVRVDKGRGYGTVLFFILVLYFFPNKGRFSKHKIEQNKHFLCVILESVLLPTFLSKANCVARLQEKLADGLGRRQIWKVGLESVMEKR
jgi:hypothetical protein